MQRFWHKVENNIGQVRIPRVIMAKGETGGAKTTSFRNILRTWGVPGFILNAHDDLRVSDMQIGWKIEEGKLVLNWIDRTLRNDYELEEGEGGYLLTITEEGTGIVGTYRQQ